MTFKVTLPPQARQRALKLLNSGHHPMQVSKRTGLTYQQVYTLKRNMAGNPVNAPVGPRNAVAYTFKCPGITIGCGSCPRPFQYPCPMAIKDTTASSYLW